MKLPALFSIELTSAERAAMDAWHAACERDRAERDARIWRDVVTDGRAPIVNELGITDAQFEAYQRM